MNSRNSSLQADLKRKPVVSYFAGLGLVLWQSQFHSSWSNSDWSRSSRSSPSSVSVSSQAGSSLRQRHLPANFGLWLGRSHMRDVIPSQVAHQVQGLVTAQRGRDQPADFFSVLRWTTVQLLLFSLGSVGRPRLNSSSSFVPCHFLVMRNLKGLEKTSSLSLRSRSVKCRIKVEA